jgi:hypothetical protein
MGVIIRLINNKQIILAVSEQQILTSYGSLLWQLSRTITGEQPRMYVVSLEKDNEEKDDDSENLLFNDEVSVNNNK